jgi:antitoxin HicB
MNKADYPMNVRSLTDEESGGHLVEFPDLPRCVSDGKTVAEGIANAEAAQNAWIAAMRETGGPIVIPKKFALAYNFHITAESGQSA